jgi:hypothetical protein
MIMFKWSQNIVSHNDPSMIPESPIPEPSLDHHVSDTESEDDQSNDDLLIFNDDDKNFIICEYYPSTMEKCVKVPVMRNNCYFKLIGLKNIDKIKKIIQNLGLPPLIFMSKCPLIIRGWYVHPEMKMYLDQIYNNSFAQKINIIVDRCIVDYRLKPVTSKTDSDYESDYIPEPELDPGFVSDPNLEPVLDMEYIPEPVLDVEYIPKIKNGCKPIKKERIRSQKKIRKYFTFIYKRSDMDNQYSFSTRYTKYINTHIKNHAKKYPGEVVHLFAVNKNNKLLWKMFKKFMGNKIISKCKTFQLRNTLTHDDLLVHIEQFIVELELYLNY